MPYSTLFRSEEIRLVQCYIPTELARNTVSALGELGTIQFRDLNADTSSFQRSFVKEIRRVDDMERQLRFFASEMAKSNIRANPIPETEHVTQAPSEHDIDALAESTAQYEQKITHLNESADSLQKRFNELVERRHVLREAAFFFERAYTQQHEIRQSTDTFLIGEDLEGQPSTGGLASVNIGFIAGVISRSRVNVFERILWRTLRGNLFMNQSEIDEPIYESAHGKPIQKNVFIIFAHGREILNKIRKISDSLGANLYAADEDMNVRREHLDQVNAQITDVTTVLRSTINTLDAELREISNSIAVWMTILKKEKAIYQTMNLFNYDQNRKCLIAEGWCPTNNLQLVYSTLRDVSDRSGSQVPSILQEIYTSREPPTYFKTNKFTLAFQSIIDAYGVATYREVNPGLVSIITFPFLFAVMFGDLGHGFLMLLAALYLVLNEGALAKTDYGEIFDMAFYGRYIMLLMGVFSMYTGLIYNDIFSRTMSLFSSGWAWPQDFAQGETIIAKSVGTYVFGLDPAWHGAENALLFTNSLKMKMSVILGVCHMTFSLCLSLFNYRYFDKRLDIWAVFTPSMLFMQSILGYLVIIIIYKWSVDWIAAGISPPGLLNTLIYMFLSPGKIDGTPLYRGQAFVQIVLLLLALICVPWLLFMKPLVFRWEHNKARAQGYHGIPSGDLSRISTDGGSGTVVAYEMAQEEEFDFGDVMIHQVIHTIEFCLNCISHTASYLRLWALSLAHNQLSVVLWDMALGNAFKMSGVIGIIMTVILFALWFVLTIAVLIVMEGTSAMLHSLRLHWVEMMSKFYEGTGYAFEPFGFQAILDTKEL